MGTAGTGAATKTEADVRGYVMGAILSQQQTDERMAELTALLGHFGEPDAAKLRPCGRCGRHRGRGQKWCIACRTLARKEYNRDYYQRTYQRKLPAEVSAARRAAVRERWKRRQAIWETKK